MAQILRGISGTRQEERHGNYSDLRMLRPILRPALSSPESDLLLHAGLPTSAATALAAREDGERSGLPRKPKTQPARLA